MINLTPLLIAVAIGLLPVLVIALMKRKTLAEAFLFKCDYMFNQAVMDISEKEKEVIRQIYEDHKPSKWRLVFSKKPLHLDNWYYPDAQRFFFSRAEHLERRNFYLTDV